MKIFAVGGAVRDELLGLPVVDRDYVVVGATPEEMVAQGFKPVGKDFPVFLHPRTHEEYALARTERKTARGYKGFQVSAAPEVTLEEDLARRDLTINAIAKDEDGLFIDPYGGMADLKAGVLRHVSPAFVEDPVRVLRVARFAARFGFAIAPETLVLMREMAANGEVDALVPERVWQELSRGLMENVPSRMFLALRECGALVRILPELDALFGVPQTEKYHPEIDTGVHVMMVVDYAAAKNYELPVRFAALTHDLGKGTTPHAEWPRHIGHEARSFELAKPLCQRLRVPNDCRELALVVARFHGVPLRAFELRPETLLKLLQETDALRQPWRFESFLLACTADCCGRLGYQDAVFEPADFLREALKVAQSVDAGAVARQCDDPAKIRDRVYEARFEAIKTWRENWAR
ncbi:multifunctional tRNA nucleotidyl transferase/2'3'-cyclic phosphodiesterase/2'nucleotidase/phosphatase [Sulfuricella denitrificans skB26]|uniref:Multifunctional CCA protein n=1 Tax=Sulfuricella denitrificans (strain DSM 22764 / NBRC 105220 / skB26) TaxID=1163617 RepID=S6B0P1_SULDS|nr:multifunctional CCA addition/repair protein [Sulfuricella denitrificans]BAN34247.1 multifunctional tRNA nucleotidyl transferase/2'3'-cyclic phosphodiesterase/2'nucleotidase/phosphatase [Sulfuricella denitrificans skB26]